jgi:hypothetical protein
MHLRTRWFGQISARMSPSGSKSRCIDQIIDVMAKFEELNLRCCGFLYGVCSRVEPAPFSMGCVRELPAAGVVYIIGRRVDSEIAGAT